MARFNNRLDHVRIAAPCKADWDQMTGNERVRFCGQCSLNVYNLSSMTRADAESLIARTEGRLCVRFYRRSDGSIITKDCPIGLRAIRRRMSYVAKAISSTVMGLLAGLGVYGVVSSTVPIAPQRTMGIMVRPLEPPVQIMGEAEKLELRMGGIRGMPMPIRNRPTSGQEKSSR
jgi:hypothetical protein